MKNFFVYILLFFTTCLFAQVQSGRITYNLIIEDEEGFKSDAAFAGYFMSAVDNAKYLSYNLDFNQEAMRYYEVETMASEGQNLAFAKAFSGSYGIFYNEKNSNVVLNQTDNEQLGLVIVNIESKREWELTTESQVINGLLCYRANSFNTVDNGKRIFKHQVIAWYCPSLPFSYGPMEYGGLPGLILSLQVRNVIFGATKIDLDPTYDLNIAKPVKGKFMTLAEFEKKLGEAGPPMR